MPLVHDCMFTHTEREKVNWFYSVDREFRMIYARVFSPLLLKFLYWRAGIGNRYIYASKNTERRKGCLIYSLIYCDNGPRAFVVLSKGLPPLPRPLPPPPPPNLVAMYNKQGILRTYFKAVTQRIWM